MDKNQAKNKNAEFDIENPPSIVPRTPLYRQNAKNGGFNTDDNTNEEQSIGMETINPNGSPEQNNSDSPESAYTSKETASTSESSSPDSVAIIPGSNSIEGANCFIENPLNELRRDLFDDFLQEDTPVTSVANRIRPEFKICLWQDFLQDSIVATPVILNDANMLISYVKPTGLFQYNHEWKEFIRILEPSTLEELGMGKFMDRAALLEENNEPSINDELSLTQWQQLEKRVREQSGHTVIGYSVNEELFLRFWGNVFQAGHQAAKLMGYETQTYEYPPRENDMGRQLLAAVQTLTALDLAASVRTAALTSLLFNCFASTYLQYNDNEGTDAAYYDFCNRNGALFLGATGAIAVISLLWLRNPYLDREYTSSCLNRFRLIQQSVLGALQNWVGYAPLILPNKAVLYGIAPSLLYGAYEGMVRENKQQGVSFINVANRTKLKTARLALGYALTVSSFIYLGMFLPINSMFFYYKDLADPEVEDKFYTIMDNIKYSALIIAFVAHLMRYPYATNQVINTQARYVTNALDGLSFSLLDGYVIMQVAATAIALIFNKNTTTPQDTLDNSCYFILQAIAFFGAIVLTCPNTRNLPELSVTHNPFEENIVTKVNKTVNASLRFFHVRQENNEPPMSLHNGSIELTPL